MVNGTFTSKLTQVNTFLCKVCTSILVTLNQFHVLPARKACAEIAAASKKIKRAETYKVIITALLLQPYRQSQKKPVRSENIVGTIGKHISTIAQNSSAL